VIPDPYPVRVAPAKFARYINLRTGQAMTTVQEWGDHTGIYTVRLSDANGFEWVGSVKDFYEIWVHEDIYDRSMAAGMTG
jgi:hypothetical protein